MGIAHMDVSHFLELKLNFYSNCTQKCANRWKFLLVEEQKKATFEAEKKLVDIGYPVARLSRTEETKLKTEHRQKLKNNPEIERLSRRLECKRRSHLNAWFQVTLKIRWIFINPFNFPLKRFFFKFTDF